MIKPPFKSFSQPIMPDLGEKKKSFLDQKGPPGVGPGRN